MENKQDKEQLNEMRRVSTEFTAVKGKGIAVILRVIFFFFLFLYSFEFLQKNSIWLYLGLAFFIGSNRYFRLRGETLILAVLSLCMVFFSKELPSLTGFMKMLAYPLCYFVGSNLWVEKSPRKLSIEKQEPLVNWSVYIFAIGMFLHLTINFIISLGTGTARNTIDFWSGEVRSATNQAGLGMLMLAVGLALLFSNKGFWKKVAAAVCLGVVVIYALVLAGRTIFALLLIVGVVSFLFMLLGNPNRGKTFWITFLLFAAALVLIWMYVSNAFGIQDIVTSSNFYNRFFGEKMEQGLEETGRWELKAYYLDHFFENIWGGLSLREGAGGYAHDILLDTYDEWGILALLSVFVFLLISLFQTTRFVLDRRFSFDTRQLVLCVNVTFAVVFFLEPLLQGMPWMFCAFCFIQGVIVNARENADRIDKLRRTDDEDFSDGR